MQRTFIEKKSAVTSARRQAGWKSSRLELGAGLAILLLLLAGNIISYTHAEALNREDLRQTPPQWRFLQRWLYEALETKTEPYQRQESEFSFDIFNHSSPPFDSVVTIDTAGAIISTPKYTAVAGRGYEYQVQAAGFSGRVVFQLKRAPSGMTIDSSSGVMRWTPAAEQIDKYEVEVVALSGAPQGSKQSYPLYVTARSHPLGTDIRGRDMMAALVLGSRWSLLPGLVAVSVAMIFGLLFGGWAGYYGGRVEAGLDYVSSVFEAFPSLVLLFLAAVIFGYKIFPVMLVVGLIRFPRLAKAVKGKVLVLKAQQFIEAAQELGLRDREILWKEIIWHNARPLLLTQISFGFAFAILVEVTLSYLHLGVQIPLVSWGNMLDEGKQRLFNQEYWLFFFPALAVVTAILGFYLLGDAATRLSKIRGE